MPSCIISYAILGAFAMAGSSQCNRLVCKKNNIIVAQIGFTFHGQALLVLSEGTIHGQVGLM